MKFWVAPAGLHIAPGDADDAKALAKLHAGAFYRGWPASEFASYLRDAEHTPAYVAKNPRKKVGGFAMLRIAADEAELLTIVVDPKQQGKGIGAAILRACLDDLQFSPVRRMFLEVEDANQSAIALYSHLGFIKISERKGYYPKADGAAATALVMRRELD